jgi:hypothetical protein
MARRNYNSMERVLAGGVDIRAIAPLAQPGTRLWSHTAGHMQVLSRVASSSGMRFSVRLSGRTESMTLKHLSSLDPLSLHAARVLRNIASIRFHHTAASAMTQVTRYIQAAIEDAGLPLDPKAKWGGFISSLAGPLLRNFDPYDVATSICDELVRALFQAAPLKRLFHAQDNSSTPVEQQVTRFLIPIIRNVVRDVASNNFSRDYVKGGLTGMGETNEIPFETLADPNADGMAEADSFSEGGLATLADTKSQSSNMEESRSISQFFKGFDEYLTTVATQQSVEYLHLITKLYSAGEPTSEINAELASHLMKLSPDQEKANRAARHLTRLWLKKLKEWAADPANQVGSSAFGRSLLHNLEVQPGKPVPMLASLRMAAVAPGEEEMQVTQAAPARPPAPTNPNVQQQMSVSKAPEQVSINTGNPVPAATNKPDDQDEDQQQKKPTIAPEIPGVNHTASQESHMKPTSKKPASRVASKPAPAKNVQDPSLKRVMARMAARRSERKVKLAKFAKLRRVAAEEPEVLQKALMTVADAFREIPDSLEAFSENLDLVRPGKTASIRERVAARNRYAAAFRQIAEEQPERIAEALNDLYAEVNDAVDALEDVSDQLGIELVVPESDAIVDADDDMEPTDDYVDEDVSIREDADGDVSVDEDEDFDFADDDFSLDEDSEDEAVDEESE